MVVCLLSVSISISRLVKFACFLSAFILIQSNLVLIVHAVPGNIKVVSPSLNSSFPFDQAENFTGANSTGQCVDEEIDSSLPYYSLPYRIFAGTLVVPITFCAISGNILVIYVIKHYHSLRITGNVFLASLAVADVGVSTLAMTFYGLQLLQGRWILGAVSHSKMRYYCLFDGIVYRLPGVEFVVFLSLRLSQSKYKDEDRRLNYSSN